MKPQDHSVEMSELQSELNWTLPYPNSRIDTTSCPFFASQNVQSFVVAAGGTVLIRVE